MITEQYVNFETAKLLKEKKFDEVVKTWYNKDGNCIFSSNRNNVPLCARPTLQMACKWLRDIFGILISINPTVDKDNQICIRYYIWDTENDDEAKISGLYSFENYDECMEDAIKYCLKNIV